MKATTRGAYACIGTLDNGSLNDYNLEEAASKAIVKNIFISLIPQEEQLFQTIEQAAIAYETKSPPFDNPEIIKDLPLITKPIEIRIAGGWVRDKIVKKSSHDVDIALDSLSGHQFAIIIQQYLIHQQTISKSQTNGKKIKIAVIAANPSQSKHLETATMKIHDIDCDFVHLRGGEVYSNDSRIPTLKEDATPLDDALRRDFTVNSLFYNLRKKHVEDWTGRGLTDLIADKILVTPLDASITFHDDPLRVLRAVRFAVRYDLALSNEIKMAAMSANVHESLHVKVSRERVGKELEGMLTGKNARPCVALNLIAELKLAGCVFEFPHNSTYTVMGNLHGVEYGTKSASEQDRKRARERSWLEATEMLKYCTPVIESFGERMSNLYISEDSSNIMSILDHRIFYLSTFLYPLRNMICVDAKEKEISLAAFIVRESIKYPNRDTTAITVLLRHIDEIRSIFLSFDSSDESTFCRLRSGLALRNLKDLWVTALLVAVIAEIRAQEQMALANNAEHNGVEQVSYFMNKAFNFFEMVQKHGLDSCWKVRPLLDGKALLKSLELPRGPIIGTYLEEQVKWMLLNPGGSKDDCEFHLKEVRKRDLEVAAATSTSKDGSNVCMDGSGIKERSESDHCSKKAHIEQSN
jgi:tRNA nucleotidyltransferase (CCA-adding enzyme)